MHCTQKYQLRYFGVLWKHFKGFLVWDWWDLETQRYPKDTFQSVNFIMICKLWYLHPTAFPALFLQLADHFVGLLHRSLFYRFSRTSQARHERTRHVERNSDWLKGLILKRQEEERTVPKWNISTCSQTSLNLLL